MKLSEQDLKLFFGLMMPLQYYVNQKSRLVENVKSFRDFSECSLSEKKKVRDYLFKHIEIIDDYIEDNAHRFDRDEIDILLSWKRFVSGNFIIERYLNKYTVFIMEGKVYAVMALQESIAEVLDGKSIPMYVKTVLLPFKGQIVYDGILEPYGISFGGGVKTIIKDSYRNAKLNGTIIHDLLAAPLQVGKLPEQKIRKELLRLITELQELAQNLESCKIPPTEANSVLALLKVTVQYTVDRFNVYDPKDYDLSYKQFKKLKQAFNRFEKS